MPPWRSASCLHGGTPFAGWREDMKTFRVGMIAEEGAGQAVPGVSILKRAYSQALGIPVEMFVARDFAALIEAQATSRVDYAIYSTTAYAAAACYAPASSRWLRRLARMVPPASSPFLSPATANFPASRRSASTALQSRLLTASPPPCSRGSNWGPKRSR